jgi:hypothetical protein
VKENRVLGLLIKLYQGEPGSGKIETNQKLGDLGGAPVVTLRLALCQTHIKISGLNDWALLPKCINPQNPKGFCLMKSGKAIV